MLCEEGVEVGKKESFKKNESPKKIAVDRRNTKMKEEMANSSQNTIFLQRRE